MDEVCLHCLSAFSVLPTVATANQQGRVLRLHCLSAFSVLPTNRTVAYALVVVCVSIAFRRSVFSRLASVRLVTSLRARSLHCLSAFSVLPTRQSRMRPYLETSCLHCLSAFSVLPTAVQRSISRRKGCESPLPFGVQCSPDRTSVSFRVVGSRSPLPFGVQCSPDVGSLDFLRTSKVCLHCLSAFSVLPT